MRHPKYEVGYKFVGRSSGSTYEIVGYEPTHKLYAVYCEDTESFQDIMWTETEIDLQFGEAA